MNMTSFIYPYIRGRWAALCAVFSLALVVGAPAAFADDDDDDDDDLPAAFVERVERLEATEEIRTVLLKFAAVVDSGDVSALNDLIPRLAPNFVLTAIAFGPSPQPLVFYGVDGLLNGFGPILMQAQANIVTSAIDVELGPSNQTAVAKFKFVNSVVPPEIISPVDVRILLFAANTAELRKEGGIWKLESLTLEHSVAYPGSLPTPP